MRSVLRNLLYVFVILGFSSLGSGRVEAQGITSAAVQGTITREGGHPIEASVIRLINSTTGARQQTMSRANGRYNLENVPVGGPYTIEVRGIGIVPAPRTTGVTPLQWLVELVPAGEVERMPAGATRAGPRMYSAVCSLTTWECSASARSRSRYGERLLTP